MNSNEVKIRFIIVGIWNTIFGYGVYLILYEYSLTFFVKRYISYMVAIILSNIIAIINAYIFHKYITFKSKVTGMIKIIKEFARFVTTYLSGIIFGLVSLPILVEVFGLNPPIAGALITLLCAIISYLGHSRFSFKG